jgi:RNA polymerase sigma-70 factor (ECF subfamily)
VTSFGSLGLGELPDHELVAALATRSEDAFMELFRRYARPVGNLSRTILGGSARSDDVVAEVFFALWLTPSRFDAARGSLLGYLRVQAKGKSIDVVRSEAARVRREQADAIAMRDMYGGYEPVSDESGEVMTALMGLPAREREPIELAYIHGMTYRAIAIYLGIPEGTAKGRIRAGLRRLRQAVEAPL